MADPLDPSALTAKHVAWERVSSATTICSAHSLAGGRLAAVRGLPVISYHFSLNGLALCLCVCK